MAGYVSRHTHHVYEGRYKNRTGAALENGMVVAVAAQTVPNSTEKEMAVILPSAGTG